MDEQQQKTKKYWDNYYGSRNLASEEIPSQFAVFVCNEFPNYQNIIDFGCGSGRDSFFFARHFSEVIGVDGSYSAIKICEIKKSNTAVSNISFYEINLSSAVNCNSFYQENNIFLNKSVFYARFFLHAVDENTEKNFLKIAGLASSHDAVIAVEFRTLRDKLQPKVTDTHYRRYIDPLRFIENARLEGLQTSYFTEGFGLAKYLSDDAHVARLILTKNV